MFCIIKINNFRGEAPGVFAVAKSSTYGFARACSSTWLSKTRHILTLQIPKNVGTLDVF